ncbi:MAG: cytochrome P460 family protein [Candidatus Marinimicrobia bacterium]|nr:cytochrome P460 family protein [Candidatus Neomarinimicrobiota bacterium]
MKKRLLVALVMTIVLLLSSTGLVLAGGRGLPTAEGQAVYDYITQTSPYQNWSLFPRKGKLYKGQHPHGALLTSYVNDIALKGINDRVGILDDGAIIIKENYMPDKTLGAVTVMYRVKGYDPDAGDWFWAKYKADGAIAKAGKVAGCIGCHTAAISNDWVFTGPVK